MAGSSSSVKTTLYVLLIMLGVFLHMLLSGEALGSKFALIFQEPLGIFNTLGFFFSWIFFQIFSVNGLYLLGIAALIEFVVTPLFQKYKLVTFRTTFTMSLIASIYVLFLFRIIGVVFGI